MNTTHLSYAARKFLRRAAVCTAFLLPFVESANAGNGPLLFEDTFETGTLNTDKWSSAVGNGLDIGEGGWGNKELQYYKVDNVSVSTTGLAITAQKVLARTDDWAKNHLCWYGSCNYTSGKVESPVINEPYGTIEVRAKVPKKPGLWASIVVFGVSEKGHEWPDTGMAIPMESRGSQATRCGAATHSPGVGCYGDTAFKSEVGLPEGQSFADDFHTFKMVTSPDKMDFYVDDAHYYTVTKNDIEAKEGGKWVFDKPYTISLRLAVGGGHFEEAPSPLDDSIFPATMLVEYVRVYGQAEEGGALGAAE